MGKSMGGHEQSTRGNETEEWITPQYIIEDLGPFDLDPCAAVHQPWPCASKQYTQIDNGLMLPWQGFIFLNPPYGKYAERWLERMANHNNGIALIFARTETKTFHRLIWNTASSILFIEGRITFCKITGELAPGNAGAPSVLVAYGNDACERLRDSKIKGKLIDLKQGDEHVDKTRRGMAR
jgi:hypothetical protein